MLTPSQIHRLVANYYVADYEAPIAPEILREVSSKVVPGDKTDHLLLPPDDHEGGPYEVPLPRTIAGLETYIPVRSFYVSSLSLISPRLIGHCVDCRATATYQPSDG